MASLSFLGLGTLPPNPEWGAMITEGAKNFYQWWIAVAPGLAMVTVVLGFNFLGDGLRDAVARDEAPLGRAHHAAFELGGEEVHRAEGSEAPV